MSTVPDMSYDFAPAWRPEKDDILEGQVISIDVGYSEYGQYPIVTVEQASGTRAAFHAFHTAAVSQLASKKPKVGDTIGIKYLGMQKPKNPTKGQSDYHSYRVVVHGADGSFDWNTFGSDD